MRVYRLARPEYARSAAGAMSGEGGLYGAGRWHSRGRRIVYTASSVALAVLEIAVNLQDTEVQRAYHVMSVDVPDDLVITLESLPAGWDTLDEPLVSREIGDLWLAEQASVALAVPSVVVPSEYNVLLNPAHERFSDLDYSDPAPYTMDPRLLSVRTSN